MRTFVSAAVLAAVGVVGSGAAADAQVVVSGPYGPPAAATFPNGPYSPAGYASPYTPYAGTVYRPYASVTVVRPAPVVVGGYYGPAYPGHYHHHHGPVYTPYYGGGRSYYGGGYRRW